jgi:glycyl-radical enzyme activating protein/glucokinase-like ROK family protein
MNDDWVIGVDLGGTKIEIGLISPENRVTARVRIPTNPGLGPRSVVERIAREVETLTALRPSSERPAALGLCSPGPVDNAAGTLLDPPNLGGLHYSPLQHMLSERLGIPVQIEHDAKAACLGEYYYGAGRGERSMTYIITGTGVGSASILNGQMLRGQNNTAGEVGHVPLDRDGDVCSCGSRGCFETFIAGPWLVRRYQRKVRNANLESLPNIAAPSIPAAGSPDMSAVDVVNLALAGDPLARQVMEEAGGALGAAVATLAMLLDVDLFVIGGSVVKSGDLLLEPARRAVPAHCYRSVGSNVRIVATELGEDGHILGCAWLARHALAEASRKSAGESQAVSPAEDHSTEPRLEDVEGLLFNVQRFSVHDGPGIRTNIFFKGCPLRCAWCCNPESQRFQPELGLSAQQCIHCGQFKEICAEVWTHGAVTQAEKDKFGPRADACPGGALRWLGARRTAGDVIAEALRDQPFYSGVGGITLTGGEPTAQPIFAEALLRLAKRAGLSTAMETCGHTRWKVFERLLPYLDLVLFDLKHMDPEVHRRWTGVDNEVILSNLRHIAEVKVPVTVRVPLIPGFNADPESLSAIARFVAAHEGLQKRVSLLPFHTLGKAKYAALGRSCPTDGQEPISPEKARELADILEAQELEVSIGS